MSKFKEVHPNYQTYESEIYELQEMPKQIFSALQGLVIKAAKETQQGSHYLKKVINLIAESIPCELGTAWSADWLKQELDDYTSRLSNAKFYRQMDFFLKFAEYEGVDVAELNELFEDESFGYKLQRLKQGDCYIGNHYEWILRDNVVSRTESIEETIETVQAVCSQAVAHFVQAKEQLTQDMSDRDIKDAVRDCLSAMESVVKKITNTNDIKEAIQEFRSSPHIWGRNEVVKEGLTLWDRMHNFYPDIRHGHPSISDLQAEEAIFWIERISAYVRYITKMYQKNSI